jgi:type III restriction enzyme
VPPCFIIVCQNTAISKLVFDYVSGFERENADGTKSLENGRLPLFRNFDAHGAPLAKPNTLLIDSEQLESGDALDSGFRAMAADEIERFRREIVERTGRQPDAADLSDQDLLREVMNTVGKPGTLGGGIRCVVSVAMLTEGWDANTVTHVLGVRAFGHVLHKGGLHLAGQSGFNGQAPLVVLAHPACIGQRCHIQPSCLQRLLRLRARLSGRLVRRWGSL